MTPIFKVRGQAHRGHSKFYPYFILVGLLLQYVALSQSSKPVKG